MWLTLKDIANMQPVLLHFNCRQALDLGLRSASGVDCMLLKLTLYLALLYPAAVAALQPNGVILCWPYGVRTRRGGPTCWRHESACQKRSAAALSTLLRWHPHPSTCVRST